jgi:hypothetical protein
VEGVDLGDGEGATSSGEAAGAVESLAVALRRGSMEGAACAAAGPARLCAHSRGRFCAG